MRTTFALAATAILAGSAAQADCAIENEVEVKILAAAFEAWKAVTDAMAECGNVQAELDQQFRVKQPSAFAANPALYQVGGVSNGTITPLLNEGTIRPLDDLVEKYGQHLKPNQLIRIDGNIMAVAMMVNTFELAYRSDLFEEHGIEVPTDYDALIAAAEKLQGAEGIDYPLGAMTKSGWDLALDFVNLFQSSGKPLVNDDSTPNVNNETGIATLELMKTLSGFMDPEYLVSDSTYVQQQMQQSKIAMANMWASRAGAVDDETESQVVGKVETAMSPIAPFGDRPVATIWWDGIVIAKNIPDDEAEAAFRVAMEGMDTEMVQANNDAAVWLIDGYQPGRLAQGAIATATHDPAPLSYPSTVEMGLMHTALGNEVSAYLTGSRSAERTLEAVEQSYLTAAREAGVLN
ncbi:ABC transporter substrate-binding protein [Oceaniovalibus guishaninsula JLT2003]|uniref:ABC transporter substrate-binding protein n=1 Tax=Oceaniovalibus guishaninsula JLT2003 TaxID=1231392 RepID=K2I2P1_9RHOB|nr:extracellular solute-binding protein [Oceaniovalibus guishaninsula]EKE43115.1 ABC transporter substrate-binding protein [Oceaniovalibus guishaninsula JLT2003]